MPTQTHALTIDDEHEWAKSHPNCTLMSDGYFLCQSTGDEMFPVGVKSRVYSIRHLHQGALHHLRAGCNLAMEPVKGRESMLNRGLS